MYGKDSGLCHGPSFDQEGREQVAQKNISRQWPAQQISVLMAYRFDVRQVRQLGLVPLPSNLSYSGLSAGPCMVLSM